GASAVPHDRGEQVRGEPCLARESGETRRARSTHPAIPLSSGARAATGARDAAVRRHPAKCGDPPTAPGLVGRLRTGRAIEIAERYAVGAWRRSGGHKKGFTSLNPCGDRAAWC